MRHDIDPDGGDGACGRGVQHPPRPAAHVEHGADRPVEHRVVGYAGRIRPPVRRQVVRGAVGTPERERPEVPARLPQEARPRIAAARAEVRTTRGPDPPAGGPVRRSGGTLIPAPPR
ncbi:hypothetical protein GCM10025870_16060 [Agromyces marinus]|uniref:Uncharacterized protein n=1 Tax=Agromyces marinus TaxID=1389020 RepID=A0ABN6YGH9_9MICO|nr:hypothetical protein GCM10025870_16060 [Agromyces marinus]